jgi:uncharacterized protein YukE
VAADLTLDRGPFIASLMAARTEAGKGVKVPVIFDISNASMAGAIRDAKAAFKSSSATMPLQFSVNQAAVTAGAVAARAAFKASGQAVTMPITFTVTSGAVAAGAVAARAAFKASGQSVTMPVSFTVPIAQIILTSAAVKALTDALTAMTAAAGGAAGGGGIRGTGTAAAAAGAAAGGAAAGFGRLRGSVALFAGLAGTVSILTIALHASIEAFVAIVPAAAALGVTLYAMAPAAQDVYQHLQSIDTVNGSLGSNIPPLTGKFAALQSSMSSNVLELYGGGLNLINRNTGVLGQTVHQVGGLMDNWIAKIDLWSANQNNLGKILQSGVGFLDQWGKFFGYIGIAIDNLVKADPGVAHFMLDIADGAAKVLDWITKLPAPLLTMGLGLHAAYLWGGLAVTALGNLARITGISKLASAVGLLGTNTAIAADGSKKISATFAGMSAMKWAGITAVAAAIGYLAYEMTQANGATKGFIASTTAGLNSMSPGAALTAIPDTIAKFDQKIRQLNQSLPQLNDQLKQNSKSFFDMFGAEFTAKSGGAMVSNAWGMIVSVGRNLQGTLKMTGILFQQGPSIDAYKVAIDGLFHSMGNIGMEMGTLGKNGYNAQQSLALMSLAGVSAGDSFALMKQKVDNLITGYENMSVQGGILANGVNAVTFAADLQGSKVSALTTGYTTFLGVVTGGETALNTFAQGLLTQAASAKIAGASYQGLNAQSLTLRSNFESNVTAAGAMFNAMVTQTAAAGLGTTGTKMLTQAGKDLVGTMLNSAKGSQANTAQLWALAQVAGYTGPDSFKALSQWVGNTAGAQKNLLGITDKLTIASAGLAADVQNLANAISQNLNQAMSTAIFQASGGQKVFDAFANSVLGAHGNIQKMIPSAQQLATTLLKETGNTTQAHAEFDTFSIGLGLTRQQADNLWASLNKLGNQHVSPTVVATAIGQGLVSYTERGLPSNASGYLSFHAAGGMIGGRGGPKADDQIIAASTGEYVIQQPSVQKYGVGLMESINAGRYASGGLIGVDKTAAEFANFAPWMAAQDSSFMGSAMGAFMKAASAKMKSDITTAAASTSGSMSAAQVEAVWTSVGGPVSAAANMARIAMAESGDVPGIVQQGQPFGLTGMGLWQITPTSGIVQNGQFGNLLNASNNAKAALYLFNASGYGPWTSDAVGAALVGGGGMRRAGGYASGTSGAAPGWGVVGEQGIELVKFHGGEQVVPHDASMMALGGLPGYASGAGAPTVASLTAQLKLARLQAALAGKVSSENRVSAQLAAHLAAEKGATPKRLASLLGMIKTEHAELALWKAQAAALARQIAALGGKSGKAPAAVTAAAHFGALAEAGKDLMATHRDSATAKTLNSLIAGASKAVTDDKLLEAVPGIGVKEKRTLAARQVASSRLLNFWTTESSELMAYRTQLANSNATLRNDIGAAHDMKLTSLATTLGKQLTGQVETVQDINKWLGPTAAQTAAAATAAAAAAKAAAAAAATKAAAGPSGQDLITAWLTAQGWVVGGTITPPAAKAMQWFDTGGRLPTGVTMVGNQSGGSERILSHGEEDALSRLAGGTGGSKVEALLGQVVRLLGDAPGKTAAGVGDAINGAARGAARRGQYTTR